MSRVRLVQIVRYPVKSLQGEPVSCAEVEANGLRGDRCWGIRDETTGKILTARRAPELLQASATLASDGFPLISLPTGATCRGPGKETDATLSTWLGRPVRLVHSVGLAAASAEFFADATDDASEAIAWTMPANRFVDAMPLLVLTTASLRAAASLHPDGDWDVRRFRANLLVEVAEDGWVEDAWCGQSTLRIAAVQLRPQELCIRCTMVTRPQPGLTEDRDIFRTLARHHDARFGAWTAVDIGGVLNVGDDVLVDAGLTQEAARLRIGEQRQTTESASRFLDRI
jgi:uncharacterized protein